MAVRGRGPNRADQANALRWESGGRKNFARWASHEFLPALATALQQATETLAGEVFGEAVFDAFLMRSVPLESAWISKHFGYPAAGTKDDALMGMWGQTMSNLRLRHPDQRGKLTTPTSVYENDYTVLKGVAQTLGAY